MKTKLCTALLFLIALSSITGARADESLADRIKEVFKDPPRPRGPTAVAAVRG
ncbi:MAG: hypothetical protein J0L73_20195 [Verrucomicrobia bacterium]|nr:hypothetical protein [Verrucomicrobiota bacterium]